METSTWALAGGSASAFALAIVLNHLSWPIAFAVVAMAVMAWAWQAPVIEGAALGGIGWLCVTGFDVYTYGDLKITGRDDALRMVALIGAGVLASLAGRAVRSVQVEPAEDESVTVPSPRPGTRRVRVLSGSPTSVLSGTPTKESRDG
jgi:hypothetical protein